MIRFCGQGVKKKYRKTEKYQTIVNVFVFYIKYREYDVFSKTKSRNNVIVFVVKTNIE